MSQLQPITLLKVLCNTGRYALITALLQAKKDLCVYELATLASLSQSATSHQLAYLESHGVVRSVRMGKSKCYFLTNTPLARKLVRVIKVLSST